MATLTRGDRLCGRYTLIAKLGTGGHSEVWHARDLVRRDEVALKILKQDLGEKPEAWALLEHEHAVASELGHPGILKVYEPQRCEGHAILPMAYAPGGDLSALRGAAYTRVVPVLIAIAQALEHAHGRGVVHRDLKPGNVLLDGEGNVLIADFGVASFSGGSPYADHGSPFSASPQALRGEPPTPADDIYGLGTLAYELLTGYPPFYPQFELSRMLEEPVTEVKSIAPAPPRLIELVLRMLAKAPERRPADMRAVIDELHASLHDTVTIESETINIPLPPLSEEAAALAAPTGPLPEMPRGGSADDVVVELPELQIDEPGRGSRLGVRRGRSRTGAILSVITLLAALGVVFFVLPRHAPKVATPATDAAAIPAAAPDTGPSPEMLAEAEFAQQLETLRDDAAKRLETLEAEAASVWGGEEFAAAKAESERLASRADEATPAELVPVYGALVAALSVIESKRPAALAAQLKAGDEAIVANDPVAARSAYELALRIEPDNAQAVTGLQRVTTLEVALPLIAQAVASSAAGNTSEAIDFYRQALAADPQNLVARAGLDRAQGAVSTNEYARTLANGFSALEAGDLGAARLAFERAASMQPGERAPQDGLAQVAAAEQAREADANQSRARELERAERWADALAIYEAVLAKDSTLGYAQAGRERAGSRAELARRLQRLIDEPDRLATSSVRTEAGQLLEAARAAEPQGPVIRSQIARLELLLPAYDQAVSVALESDNATEVTIQRVGALGAFLRREIELKPGRYTLLGTRAGYRDIRREVTIAPGSAPQTITISCVEPI